MKKEIRIITITDLFLSRNINARDPNKRYSNTNG
jgi:hypothetical protein